MVFDVGDSGGVGVQCVSYVGLGQVVPFAMCCQGVKPRVLWRLVYLVPVVADCDCFWLFWLTSGPQAASCSAGVRMPTAECGRMVPVPVHPLGGGDLDGVDVLPRALVTDQLGLVQGAQSLGQGVVIGVPVTLLVVPGGPGLGQLLWA